MNHHDIERSLYSLHEQYEATQHADPLRADSWLPETLPILNQTENKQGLIQLLVILGNALPAIERLTADEAWAAIRDLGFVMGAIKRCGVEPVPLLPGFETVLLELARKAQCQHPRDNVFTLTVANPVGSRRRTYSGTPSEHAFIDAVGRSIKAMDACVAELVKLFAIPLSEPQFAEHLETACNHFRRVTDALVQSHKTVDPCWFSNEFVRNLKSIDIDGSPRHGPSANQSPMLLIDWFLFGASNEHYHEQFHALSLHLRPIHHQWLAEFATNPGMSLIEWVNQNYKTVESSASRQVLQGLMDLLKAIRIFRYPHRKIALNSFALRSKEQQIGSGGMSPDADLKQFEDFTEAARSQCQQMMDSLP